jgi:chorismate mutase
MNTGVGSTEPARSGGAGLAGAGAGAAAHADPVVQTFRSEIAVLDARLVATVNERIAVVAQLHRYKKAQGIPVRDQAREDEMRDYLATINAGPLSREGLAELYGFVLDLARREAADA